MTKTGGKTMKFSTFLYNLKQGLKNIWRNKMFSLASVATMTACIFLFGLFYSIGTNFQKMLREIEEGVAVTVFFNEGISEQEISDIGQQIGSRPEVKEYKYKSSDEAWEEFKADYFEGYEDAAESFGDDNPLASADSYEIYLKDVSSQAELVAFLEATPGVREVRHSEVAAKTLTDFNRLIAYISVSVIVILIAVAVFLISNTVTVGISVRREEIAIMKLIGAKDSFVRAPFIVEGVTIGLIGSIIPLVILWLGIGESSKVFLIFLGGFFTVLINVIDGIRYTDKKLIEVADVMETPRIKRITRLVIPAALPSIFTGLKVALGNCWTCVVAAELVASTSGIGYMISNARNFGQMDVVIVGMLAIGLVGKIMDSLLNAIGNRILAWSL